MTKPKLKKPTAKARPKTKQEYMQDPHGRLVPIESVKKIDIKRDALVRGIIESAIALTKQVTDFKTKSSKAIDAFVDLSAKDHSVHWGGTKGNITLTTYSGDYKLVRTVDDRIEFNEKLQVAKQLIDDCITEWSANTRSELRTLVLDAFNTDKKGKINTGRILGLRRLNIKNEKWQKAMDAIDESIIISSTKSFFRAYFRNEEGKYVQIDLGISALN